MCGFVRLGFTVASRNTYLMVELKPWVWKPHNNNESRDTMISKDSVAHVAELSRLAFSDAELDQFTNQLDDILNMVDQLETVDTTGVPATTQSIHLQNVMREDVAVNDTETSDLFKNVPTSKGTLIQVPAIIDKEED